MLDSNIKNLQAIQDFIDFNLLEKISNIFLTKKQILIVAHGYSGTIAKNFYYKIRTSLPNVHFLNDSFAMYQYDFTLNKNCLIFVISQTGQSTSITKFLQDANEKNAISACLTRVNNTPVSNLIDYPIVISSANDHYDTKYLNTEVAFKIILDSIYRFIAVKLHQQDNDYHTELFNSHDSIDDQLQNFSM